MFNHKQSYIPVSPPSDFFVTESDILAIWDRLIKIYGNRNLNVPLITYDSEYPIHFGMIMNWHIVINLYYLPRNVPTEKILWWIEYAVLHHELNHYHSFPYDGVTIVKYKAIIYELWENISSDMCHFLFNYFADIVVDWILATLYPHDFPVAQMYWIEWIDTITKKNKMEHSKLWKIMIRIFELKCHISTNILIDAREEKISRQIYTYFNVDTPWIETLQSFVLLIKEFMIAELNGFASPIASLSTYKTKTNTEKESKLSSAFQSVMNYDSYEQTNQQNLVTYNEKACPFDIFTMRGDMFSTQMLSHVSSNDEQTELQKSMSELAHISRGTGISFSKLLQVTDLITNQSDQHRLWMRMKAKSMIRYDMIADRNSADMPSGFEDWKWDDPLSLLNWNKSILTNPIYFFPPNAKKIRYVKGVTGKKFTDFWDMAILIDSSESMGKRSHCEIATKFDYALLSAFALLSLYAEKNIKASLINFSDTAIASSWLSYTEENLRTLEHISMQKINRGTQFPTKELNTLLEKNDRCVIIIISDGLVYNKEHMLQFLKLEHFRYPIFFFCIGNEKKSLEFKKSVEEFGVSTFLVEKYEDLCTIVLKSIAPMFHF